MIQTLPWHYEGVISAKVHGGKNHRVLAECLRLGHMAGDSFLLWLFSGARSYLQMFGASGVASRDVEKCPAHQPGWVTAVWLTSPDSCPSLLPKCHMSSCQPTLVAMAPVHHVNWTAAARTANTHWYFFFCRGGGGTGLVRREEWEFFGFRQFCARRFWII